MNSDPIFHLVILITEQVPKLSERINFSATALPCPFVFLKSVNTKGQKSELYGRTVGKRRFSKITIEFYILDDMDSTTESIQFCSGNPMVETTEGIIHVYKNNRKVQPPLHGITSAMLCIFSVPAHVTVRDLLVFVAPMRKSIHELKVVKNDAPNRYMVLLKFRSQEEADQFFSTYNNTRYRGLESEVCQLMYVSHVDTTHPSLGCAFPSPELLELPSCPVCLERLDEPVQGILTTILCNHTFHDGCISQVEDTTCPVCRYVQSPELLNDSECADCSLKENLWICLICGRIGCGRYGQKHAYHHFEQTGHTFALELGKSLVWDYADDAYVHRLAVNHEDGKLVQLGAGSETGDKKTDQMSLEFTAVLTSQLDSQRAYFEEQLVNAALEANVRIQAVSDKVTQLTTEVHTLKQKLQEANKDKEVCSRKLQQATSLAQRLQKELTEERALTESLTNNEILWRDRAEKANEELKETRQEINELMLNLELRHKLEELTSNQEITNEEMETSAISIGQQTNKASSSRRKKKR